MIQLSRSLAFPMGGSTGGNPSPYEGTLSGMMELGKSRGVIAAIAVIAVFRFERAPLR